MSKTPTNLIAEKIKDKLKMNNSSVNKLSKLVFMSSGGLSKHLRDGTLPKFKLNKIAELLSINPEFLFDNNNNNLLE
jgi:hypothetical protein